MVLKQTLPPSIEIILSTINDGIFNLKLNLDFKYTVIHQIPNISDYKKYELEKKKLKELGVNYIQTNSSGLSLSRNIGIDNASGDYIWIMDDDVLIYPESKEILQKYLSENSADMFILNHRSNTSYQQGIREKKINFLSAMSVSSIDMLIKKDSIGTIKFDENFGLGKKYPSGEEYIFCCDMLKKNKKIQQTNLFTSYHPSITSGDDFYTTPLKLATKKHMFIRAHNKYIGCFLYALFLIKKFPTIAKNKAIKNMIKSFKL